MARGRAQASPKPDFGGAGANWSDEGWMVPVDYATLERQIRPKEHIDVLRPFLPAKYSPLQTNGNGLQSVYLAAVPVDLADALIGLIGQAYWDAFSSLVAQPVPLDLNDTDDAVVEQTIVGPTYKEQLIKARRGQGVFRVNVLLREKTLSRDKGLRSEASQGEPHQAMARGIRRRATGWLKWVAPVTPH